MMVELDEQFVDEFELERVKIREEVYIRSAQLSKCEEDLIPLIELKKEYEDIVSTAKVKKDYLGEFVYTYLPAINNLTRALERQNVKIKKLLDLELTEEFTLEDKESQLGVLTKEKEGMEVQLKLFNEQLAEYQKNYNEADKKAEEYSALLESVKTKIEELERDKKQFSSLISQAKFNLKQLKTNYKKKSMVSRTDIERLPDAENYMEVSLKSLLNFWDKKPHVMPNEYTVFPQVDPMEIGEELIVSGRIVHKQGKFYRGVTVDYDKEHEDYLRLDYSSEEGIVKRSSVNYLINLDNYFDGIRKEEVLSEYKEAKDNLSKFLKYCPQGVKALPLYIFDKKEIVALVGDSIKNALDIVIVNYKKQHKTEEIPESLTNYVRGLYSELEKKIRLSNERWNKNKN